MEVPMSDYKNGDTASWDSSQVRRSRAGQTGGGQQRRPPQQRRRRRRRINPILYILCVLAASAILAGVGWLLASDLFAFSRDIPSTQDITIEVTAEDDMGSIADKLQNAGLIKYKWFFRLFASVTGASDEVGIGTYTLNTDMDYHALIAGMRSSSGNLSAETVTVTIPEGYTVRQTIALLAENGVNTEEALTEAAQTADFDYDFIDNDSEDLSRLEGFLFPDTYEFYVNHNAEDALDRLIRNFVSRMDEDRMAQVEASDYSLREILTIASLIEEETDGTDQANIASVIYNRLEGPGDRQGTYGLLQIDASLLYALPDHEGPITSADMQTDSPYNLYQNAGLPPTPISNPGHLQPGPGVHRCGPEPQRYGLLLLRPGQRRPPPLLHHPGGAQRLREQQLLWRLNGKSRSCWLRRGIWSGCGWRCATARTRCIWRGRASGCGPSPGTSLTRSCRRRCPSPTTTASGSTAPSTPCPGTTRCAACRSTWSG